MSFSDWCGFGCSVLPCADNTTDEDILVEYPQNATALYRAIERRQWATVNNFLKTGCWKNSYFADRVPPKIQVRTWVVKYEEFSQPVNLKRISWKQLPIHAAIIFSAPAIIIQKLMSLYPPALRRGDNRGNLPIHLAFRHGSNDAVLAILLQEYPESMNCREANGLLPTECATELPSPQPLRGALLKTALKNYASSTEKPADTITAPVKTAEAFVLDERKAEPSLSNVTEPSKEGEGKDQLSQLSKQMEELKTTVHEAFTKGSGAAGNKPDKGEEAAPEAPPPKKAIDPSALNSLKEMVTRILAGKTDSLSEPESDQQGQFPVTPAGSGALKSSLAHNMSYPANSILDSPGRSEQYLKTFSDISEKDKKKKDAEQETFKKLQEKMTHMELAMKEMHNREKTVRRELAMTLKEVKRWKQEAKKATVEEEKNRILTEMLHELVPSSKSTIRKAKQLKELKNFKLSPKKLKQRQHFREETQDDEGIREGRYSDANAYYTKNTHRYFSSPRALRKTRSEIPTPTFLHGDDNDTMDDTTMVDDDMEEVIEYRQPKTGRVNPLSTRHAAEPDYYGREGPPETGSPKRRSKSEHGRTVRYDSDRQEETEQLEHAYHMQQEASPRGKQYTKSPSSRSKKLKRKKSLKSPKRLVHQNQETIRVEPTAIRLGPSHSSYPYDAMMDPHGARIESYYRPPGRTMSNDETASDDFSVSLTETAMMAAAQEEYHQQKNREKKSKKRQLVDQYYPREGRRAVFGRDPEVGMDPEVNVGSPIKSLSSNAFRRGLNYSRTNMDSTSSSVYTDDSSYARAMESEQTSYM